MNTIPGSIPLSTALTEASPNSINDYLSIPPKDYKGGELAKVVEILRAQRARWEASEGVKPRAKTGAKTGAPKPPMASKQQKTQATMEDLGL